MSIQYKALQSDFNYLSSKCNESENEDCELPDNIKESECSSVNGEYDNDIDDIYSDTF